MSVVITHATPPAFSFHIPHVSQRIVRTALGRVTKKMVPEYKIPCTAIGRERFLLVLGVVRLPLVLPGGIDRAAEEYLAFRSLMVRAERYSLIMAVADVTKQKMSKD